MTSPPHDRRRTMDAPGNEPPGSDEGFLEGFVRLGTLLAGALSLEDVAAQVVEYSCLLSGLPACLMYLAAEQGELKPAAAEGVDDELRACDLALIDLAALDLEHSGPRAVDPASLGSPAFAEVCRKAGFRQAWVAALVVDGVRVAGALVGLDRRAALPTRGELIVLRLLAIQAASAVDIALRRAAEGRAQREQLRRERHAALTLRATLESLLDPHVVLRAVRDAADRVVDFEFVDANPAAVEHIGLSPEALAGALPLAVLPGHTGAGLLAIYARVLASGEPLVLDDVAYEPDLPGHERRYDIRAVPIDADMLSYTWRDVTDRHEAAENLRRRVAELDALQQMSALLVQCVDLGPALDDACRLLERILAAERVEVRLLPDEPATASEAAATEMAGAAESAVGQTVKTVTSDAVRLLAVPLVADAVPFGVLHVRRAPERAAFGERERVLATTAADLLAAVVRKEQVRAAEKEEAVKGERLRIARDLHDAVTQSMHAARMLAENLPEVYERDPVRGREDLLVIRRLIVAAFAELRILLYELRPETLVATPLETLIERLRDALAGRDEISVRLTVEPDLDLPQDVRVTLYRVAQEALSNVGKHAKASSADVALCRVGDAVRLTVHDNGRGFDPAARLDGMGQDIMRERAVAIGATLAVESAAGAGTTVTLIWRPRTAQAAGAADAGAA